MSPDIGFLREILGFFSADQAGAWATAAAPSIRTALPHLASCPAAAQEGFPEALMALRDVLESFDPNDPERVAFELCDRLTDILEFVEPPAGA